MTERIHYWILIAALVGSLGGRAAGQALKQTADEAFGPLGALYVSQPKIDPNTPTRSADEVLSGNGTGAGYILGHGSISPGSEMVSVGGSLKKRNKDYYIDYSGGTIMFAEPVRQGMGIRVSYRYAEGDKGERNIVGIPALTLLNSGSLSLNFTMAYRAADRSNGTGMPDIIAYGLKSDYKLGGSSTLSSMIFTANPQKSAMPIQQAVNQQKAPEIKSDSIQLHRAELGFGSLKLDLGFQKVGKDFAGFRALKDSGAAPAELLAQLEKEKGLRRYNIGAALAATGGMSLTGRLDAVEDDGGSIRNRGFGIAGKWFKANLDVREVDRGFNRFKDIREADKAQLEKEKGIKRTSMSFELAPFGRPKDGPWNALRMNRIEDPSGAIEVRSIDIDTGRIAFSSYSRSIDAGFGRINDLSAQDRTDLALAIRRQFDPNATAGQVTDKDRAQISKETGIERSNWRGSFRLGGLSTSFQQLIVGDGSGDIDRRVAKISGRNFEIFAMRQSIDKSFGRMADLAPVETQHLGNEVGLERLGYGGSFKFGAITMGMSSSKIEDETGRGVRKRSLSVAGSRFDIKANFQEIDPEFDRVKDLADAEKPQMANEVGYRRYDVSAALRLAPSLTTDSFYYSAASETERRQRTQFRNKVVYNPTNGPKVTAFRDQFSFASQESGNITSYLHQIYTLDHRIGGLKFNVYREMKETQDGEKEPIASSVKSEHIESNTKKKTWFIGDHKMVEFGEGKYEETTTYNLQSTSLKRLALSHTFIGIDREEGRPDEETRTYGLKWGITEALQAVGDLSRREVSNGDLFEKQQYGIQGLLGSRILFMRDVKVTGSFLQEKQNDRIIKEAESYKMDAAAFGGTLGLEYIAGRNKDGIHPVTRIYRFASGSSDKRRLRFDLLYKDREDNPNAKYLVRAYNGALKLNDTTTLTYSYFTNVEKDKGVVDPLRGETLKLSTSLFGLSFTADYKIDSNMANGALGRRYGFGISGKLPGGELIEVYYGVEDIVGRNADYETHIYRLKFDHQIDPDHFLTLSGTYSRTDNNAPGAKDREEIESRIDFRTTFG